eukprot:2062505-Karenia_brevis.AAC.1
MGVLEQKVDGYLFDGHEADDKSWSTHQVHDASDAGAAWAGSSCNDDAALLRLDVIEQRMDKMTRTLGQAVQSS